MKIISKINATEKHKLLQAVIAFLPKRNRAMLLLARQNVLFGLDCLFSLYRGETENGFPGQVRK
jgi:hypothetical protein